MRAIHSNAPTKDYSQLLSCLLRVPARAADHGGRPGFARRKICPPSRRFKQARAAPGRYCFLSGFDTSGVRSNTIHRAAELRILGCYTISIPRNLRHHAGFNGGGDTL